MLKRLKQMRERAIRDRAAGKQPRRLEQAGMTLIEIMLVLAILATVMGVLFGPTLIGMFKSGKAKSTKILVDKYAHQAFVSWSTEHDDDCPGSIDDLNKYLGREDAKDPYGKSLVMLCGDDLPEAAQNVGIGVLSMGKDKKQGTEDDITSWKKAPKE